MTDILYLVIGAVVGGVGGIIVVLLFPYRSLRRAHALILAHLAEEQGKNNELQSAILNQQSITYQARQELLARQKRFESDLNQVAEQRADLEQQYADLKARYDREQQNHLQEITRLRDSVTRTEQEKTALQKQLSRDRAEWEREMQSVVLQNAQIEEQTRTLQRDKTLVDTRLEEQHEAWERERLALQIQINTLEDNLTLYKARASQHLSPDNARILEQLKAEATAELERWRVAWEEERKSLQDQLQRLRAESREPRDADLFLQLPQPWDRERRDLLEQLQQAREAQRKLEEQMAARDRQTEQERGALEAEIEQLMERFLHLQQG